MSLAGPHSSRVFAIALASCLLGLAGCGKRPESVPEVQGEKPVQAEAAAPTEAATLESVSGHAEMYQGQLALVLGFPLQLTGTQDFDSQLVVTGSKGETISGSWVLDEEGKTLRFPYIEANASYTVRIKPGLTAVDGQTNSSEISKDIFTGPLQPAVGFAAQGSVLPARESRGLPVVSVNVNEVDVEFLRVRDGEIANFFAAYQKNGRRGSWDLDPQYGWYGREGKPVAQIADSVYANRFILSGKENERALNYLPIQNIPELTKSGLYFAVLNRPGTFRDEKETSFYFVSDIGVHTRAYKDKMFVHTASLKTGDPISGVEISVLDANGETVVSGIGDESGNAMFAYKLNARHVLVARAGRDVSMVPFNQPALDLSEFAVSGRGEAWFDVFAWSGRDLYRPGETVRLSALLRDNDGKSIKPQPLFVSLKQPDGRLYAESRLDPGELGYFEWSREIPADAPTGRWQVEFRLDPASKEATQSLSLRIEEFLPERMKLDLASSQETLKPDEPLDVEVQGDYLYGAPAAGNRFTARLTLSADVHPVEAHKDYYFGDPLIELPKEAKDVIDSKLDEQGHLVESITLLDDNKSAPVAAVLSGSLYETGGRTVTRTLRRTVWPADALVGIRPLFDVKDGASANANAGFELIRSNAAGELLGGQNLKLSLIRERRDYHWVWEAEGGWHFNYTERYENAESREVSIEAGKATRFDVPVEWGGYRIEVVDPATGLTLRFPFTAGWSWNDDNRGGEARPDKVKLSLDKQSYRAGDTLKVTLTPPHSGPGVLIVESDKMLYTRNIEARAGSVFEIPVTEAWERHDIYLTALVFRGGSAAERITPARAVGEAFIPMDRSARKVDVQIEASKLMKPETDLPVTIKVPKLAGKKARVTVSAVDVGILNITRFAVPDANSWFFAQRRLGVDAYDLYGRVIESFTGNTAKLRYGGDMALDALPQARRPTAKVQTVDLFAGPVELDAQGNASVALKVPDFNGSLRVSALVFSDDQYGKADVETVVRADLVAEISTPRVMAPGDKAMLSLDLQNFSGAERKFNVRVEADKPLAISKGTRSLSLADNAKSTLEFQLDALEGFGVGKIRVDAEATEDGGEPIHIQREFEMVVRAGWPSVLRSDARSLDTLAPISLGSNTMDGLIPDSVNARLTLSSLPPLPFGTALSSLLRYPYGCVEQTTSKGFAALLLDQETADKLQVEGLDADARRQRIEGAIGRIASMQAGSGLFSMWGGDSSVNTFISPYVTEFLLDAREEGFVVPEAMLQKALQRLSDDLLSGGHPYYNYDQSDHMRFADEAWSAYVLARVNRAPLGTLRALYDNERSKSLTALPLVQLGIALNLMGDTKRAEQAIDEAFAMKVNRPRWLGDYGSDLRDTALMVALVERHGLSKPEYVGRVFELARLLKTDQRQAEQSASRWGGTGKLYLSTQEQVAIGRVGKMLIKNGDAVVSGELSVGGNTTMIAPDRIWSRNFMADALRAGVQLTPKGEPPLFLSTDVVGVPRTAPPVDDSMVAIQRSYFTLDGKPWAPGPLREGDALIVDLKLEAREAMPDALLVDLLPGGLEIENFNLTDSKQWADVVVNGITLSDRSSAADVQHEEFRDDRYVAALSLGQGQEAHVFYLVRAVSPGSYGVPPPLVEDMYRPEVRGIGRSGVKSIEVVQP
ncbi:alpha-2-macroglobulin [Dokdonella sp.]|uniref:alpha-2-macroglobulin family protein n=1 Tax=Dokdonella sp. TaxID=2291710 RepID=UPI0035289C9D